MNKSVYLAMAINKKGHKELLGTWVSQDKGPEFWKKALEELNHSSNKQMYVACVDNLKAFPKKLSSNCSNNIIHLIRNSTKYKNQEGLSK